MHSFFSLGSDPVRVLYVSNRESESKAKLTASSLSVPRQPVRRPQAAHASGTTFASRGYDQRLSQETTDA